MEDLKPIIAHNIQSLRQGAGMTQLDLADALHYSDKAVSKWERGESLPDILILKKIADLFQVTVDRLLRPDAAPLRQKDLHSRKIITAISLTGVAALAIIAHIIFPTWLVFLYALPAGAIVWLVLNALWFPSRFNYPIISFLMWTALFALTLTLWKFHAPIWEIMLLGAPGQAIIWLCSRFKKKKGS
ncbi:MAG: helix-turn-helix transcriptional regulator [Clostridia bacterium]|nr:helix-turn-helix transcriptional regulator [Clostridia bacterium]